MCLLKWCLQLSMQYQPILRFIEFGFIRAGLGGGILIQLLRSAAKAMILLEYEQSTIDK